MNVRLVQVGIPKRLFFNLEETVKELLRRYLDEYDFELCDETENSLFSKQETESGVFPFYFTVNESGNGFDLWLEMMEFPADYTISDDMIDLIELANRDISDAEFIENGTGILISPTSSRIPVTFHTVDDELNRIVNLAEDFAPVFREVFERKISPEAAVEKVLQMWKISERRDQP